jgi:hypothetical protein
MPVSVCGRRCRRKAVDRRDVMLRRANSVVAGRPTASMYGRVAAMGSARRKRAKVALPDVFSATRRFMRSSCSGRTLAI